jgi:hypothetical protein
MTKRDTDPMQQTEKAMPTTEDLVLCRSDAGDGGWSLHAPGSTNEEIASGDAAYLICGTAEEAGGAWTRPNHDDYLSALRMLAAGGAQ